MTECKWIFDVYSSKVWYHFARFANRDHKCWKLLCELIPLLFLLRVAFTVAAAAVSFGFFCLFFVAAAAAAGLILVQKRVGMKRPDCLFCTWKHLNHSDWQVLLYWLCYYPRPYMATARSSYFSSRQAQWKDRWTETDRQVEKDTATDRHVDR